MKKAKMTYPRIYTDIIEKNNNQFEVTFLSNVYNSSCDLIEQKEVIKSFGQFSSLSEALRNLNESEYKKLSLYINRQEKIAEKYREMRKIEHSRVVLESLNLLLDFRKRFERWFNCSENLK